MDGGAVGVSIAGWLLMPASLPLLARVWEEGGMDCDGVEVGDLEEEDRERETGKRWSGAIPDWIGVCYMECLETCLDLISSVARDSG